MGKSDPYVFRAYENILRSYHIKNSPITSICFLGQTRENNFTKNIKSLHRDFYDVSLDNWNINNLPYCFNRKYDLIICTRCPYFSNRPKDFIDELSNHLLPEGKIFIDWGLGDHFRHNNFKIGFKNDIEHESAYFEENLLSSVFWDDKILETPAAKYFMENCKKFGYEKNLKQIVEKEVPNILTRKDAEEKYENIQINVFSLWEDRPQLYIVTQMTKKV